MYSNTIEQELYGARWEAFKGKLKSFGGGAIFNSDPSEGGAIIGKKASKKTGKFLSNLFKTKEQKAKEEKERNDNILRSKRAKNKNYVDDLDRMKAQRQEHLEILRKKKSGQPLTKSENKKYSELRRRMKAAREKSSVKANATGFNRSTESERYQNAVLDRQRIKQRKEAFKTSEAKRLRNYKIGGSITGAGVGGTLGYVLSKRATRNTEPGKKRTAIRVGSTIAGAALGGVGGHYAGKKLALRGAKLRYRNFQR